MEQPCIDHGPNRTVRGWLCHKCNRGIGQFNENPDLLLIAAEYVKTRSGVKRESHANGSEAESPLPGGPVDTGLG